MIYHKRLTNYFIFRGRRVDRYYYWKAKTRITLRKNKPLELCFPIDPPIAKRMIRLMRILDISSPARLFERLLMDSFKLHNTADKRIIASMRKLNCKTTLELEEVLLDIAKLLSPHSRNLVARWLFDIIINKKKIGKKTYYPFGKKPIYPSQSNEVPLNPKHP